MSACKFRTGIARHHGKRGTPYFPPEYLTAQPGEQILKEWIAERALALGLTPGGVRRRLDHGRMSWPKIVRKVNNRVIFVLQGTGGVDLSRKYGPVTAAGIVGVLFFCAVVVGVYPILPGGLTVC